MNFSYTCHQIFYVGILKHEGKILMQSFENVGVYIREVWLEPNLLPYKYPNFLNPSHSSHLPAYEDGTDRVF